MTNAREFTARLAELLRRERDAMAEFLVLLADFDRRRLWLELGHASLFSFLHRELGLSKGSAHYRKTAAELLQRFPEIAEPLRDGRLCITSIVELAKVLTPENRNEVLPAVLPLLEARGGRGRGGDPAGSGSRAARGGDHRECDADACARSCIGSRSEPGAVRAHPPGGDLASGSTG